MSFEGEYVQVGTSGGEQIDVVETAQKAFAERGFETRRVDHDLYFEDSGILCAPRLIALDDSGDGTIATSSIVRFMHPKLFAEGAFEYQHSRGDTVEASLNGGFASWAAMDLVTLIDALSDVPENTTYMDMNFSDDDGASITRRAIFGPATHYASQPPPDDVAGDHDGAGFCPCCLTTNCMDALMELVKPGGGDFGLRLYAARDSEGQTQADCRVNGEEFEDGKAALRKYVETWPNRGLEFRKQYVIIRDA